MHNRLEYLNIKQNDIGEECSVFINRGMCREGIACRFGSKHISKEGYNIIDEEKHQSFVTQPPTITNILNGKLAKKLRNFKYNFKKSNLIIDKHGAVSFNFNYFTLNPNKYFY